MKGEMGRAGRFLAGLRRHAMQNSDGFCMEGVPLPVMPHGSEDMTVR